MKKRRAKKRRVISEMLTELALVWKDTLRAPRRRALFAALALVFVVAMLVARFGTVRTRVASAALLGLAAAGAVAIVVRERRVWDDPRTVIERVANRADPDRAARALRALTLLDEDGEPKDTSTSPALARLHVARQLAALPHDRIAAEAGAAARRMNIGALALAIGVLALGGSHAFSVIEGADVLVARAGVAPLGLPYITDMTLMGRPPEYLHQEERRRAIYGHVAVARGTLLTFRGEALHAGRRLVVTDGKDEIPFVDDGGGKVVARWPVSDSVTLRVVARFGDVVVPEPDATEVESIADELPIVKLEDAPKTISLTSIEGQGDLPIRYEATDDHGLREVQLVLKSGTREERRVLAHLDGEVRSDHGGSMLRPSRDAFIRRSHAPVLVRVEAKDNDPITGPKWGVSESFTLLPPDIGEPEARRLDALRELRDAYVDVLAWRIEKDDKRDAEAIAQKVEHTFLGSSGLAVPQRLAIMIGAEQKKVDAALAAAKRAPGAAAHDRVVKTTETMVLVIDGVVRGLARKDARSASKQLADVADDLATGYADLRVGHDAVQAKTRAEAATHVLKGGEKQLARLGMLGRDLSGAVHAGLARTSRAQSQADLQHGELAARDLATRLREADPSFGSRGGSGGHASGESGGGQSPGGGDSDEPSDAEKAFNEAVQDLEQLSEDHSGAMGKTEQALSKGLGEEEMKQLRDAAKPHAQNVRDAVKDLPTVGGGSDTWTSKGAAARELAEQMARSLESGSPDDAVNSGKQAVAAIEEAKRIAARERYRLWDDRSADGADKKLDDAKKKLEPEIKWAEDQRAQMKKRAAERAGNDLKNSGDEEQKLAERAHKIAEKGALPDPSQEKLEQAARDAEQAADALKHGDAERAQAKQQDAQRNLDAAKQATGDSPEDAGEVDDGGNARGGQADIPTADQHKGPEEFRKRVLKGLAEPAGRKHKDAITRYAEGLLR
ncbi:MAG TPA: DUF4175 domain-containing protein [Polyangiaceae bacterium]|nr:DUF4175 domain-containing protein [Polyangiaceae bacterium]